MGNSRQILINKYTCSKLYMEKKIATTKHGSKSKIEWNSGFF